MKTLKIIGLVALVVGIIYVFALVLLYVILALPVRPPKNPLTIQDREKLSQNADLVFVGTIAKAEMSGYAKAVEDHPDLRFVCTFNVQKIQKGQWDEPTFAIAVHSPTLSFHQNFSNISTDVLYTIYLKANPERPGTFIMLSAEWGESQIK